MEIQTDSDGRFQITNMPSATYDWTIAADGYMKGDYLNYSVDSEGGAVIFTFYIQPDKETFVDREEIFNHEHDADEHSLNAEVNSNSLLTQATTNAMSSTPSLRSYINVYYNGQVRGIDRQQYLYTVVSSELYDVSWYTARGLTSSQVSNLYIAQAITSNTFVEYTISVYSNHSNYDVCSTSDCQVYDPTKVTQAAINAVSSIFEYINASWYVPLILYRSSGSSYDYVYGAFGSSCNGQGTRTHSSQPALQAKSCTDLATGSGGNRYGLCQMGAAQKAKSGYSATSIVNYYFTNCSIISCRIG